MITGAIIGAILGVLFYARRAGGTLIMSDLQNGLGGTIFQAFLHALVPAMIGGTIELVIF